MAAAAGPEEILYSRSTEAVNDIEFVAANQASARTREGHHTERLPLAGHAKALDARAGRGRCGFLEIWINVSREDRHVLTDPDEFMGDLPCDFFDATAPWSETFDYDCDAQCGNPLAFAREYLLRLVLASEPRVRRIRPNFN